MSELAYLFVLAAGGGLFGGLATKWLTDATVRSMEGSANQTASGYEWVYSTGGRGAATLRDVWRQFGGGPDEIADAGPWIGFACTLVGVFLAIFCPPPVFAAGPPPLWSWWSFALVATALPVAFVVGVVVGEMLSDSRIDDLVILGITAPGGALVLLAFVSYFSPLPWLLLLIVGVAAWLGCAALLVRLVQGDALYGSSELPPAAIAGSYLLGGALVLAALFWLPFSPLAPLLAESTPGPGKAGPHGEPPLMIRELAGPLTIAAAGTYVEHRQTRALTTNYVRLVDAAGTEVQLAVSLELEPERDVLVIGGRHPSEPWARRPLSQAEGERFRADLRRALDEARARGETWPEPGAGKHDDQARPPGGDNPDDAAAARQRLLRAAAEAFARLAAMPTFPLAAESPLARSVILARGAVLEEAAKAFREQRPFERREEWQRLRPALVSQLKANPPPDLRARLIELLGPPLESKEKLAYGLDYSWDEPLPAPEEALVYPVGRREGYQIYLVLDLRPGRELDHRLQERSAPSSSGSGSGTTATKEDEGDSKEDDGDSDERPRHEGP